MEEIENIIIIIITLAYECENITTCIKGTITIVWVNTFVEIFTPSLFLYCFSNLIIKG